MVKIKTKAIKVKENLTKKQIWDLLQNFAINNLAPNFANKVWLSNLADGFAKVETNDKRVSDIVMDPISYAPMRKFGRDVFEPVTQASILKFGLLGMIWGANIWVTNDTKCNEISIYVENDEELKKDFPKIAKSKKILKR